jgi:hypothetical protein
MPLLHRQELMAPRFRDDDWSRNEIVRYMHEDNLAFSGALAGFHYLGRTYPEMTFAMIALESAIRLW